MLATYGNYCQTSSRTASGPSARGEGHIQVWGRSQSSRRPCAFGFGEVKGERGAFYRAIRSGGGFARLLLDARSSGRNPRVDALIPSAYVQRPPFEACRLEAARASRLGADQYLTSSGEIRQPCGGVHRVAQRREVSGIPFADGTNEGPASVHAGAERNPRLRPVVARLREQGSSGRNGACRMIASGEPRDEQRHCAVADELVD